MRKWWVLLPLVLVVSGCAASETFETVDDEILQPVANAQREITLTVPQSASAEVMESEDGGKLYFCDGYTMAVQTLAGGDLNRTVKALCGYGPQELTLMQIRDGTWSRQEWIWVSAGEGGEQLGRGAILDDGSYHYCLTVMADASEAAALEAEWAGVFESFDIVQ